MKIVIVGGVAGGASAAARLRRLDEQAEIILLERGSFISFANCGLPYFIGGTIPDESNLTLQTPDGFSRRFQVDVRTNSEAVELNIAQKAVKVIHDGKTYWQNYDKLILATGAAPIIPLIAGLDDDRVFVLRDIPDAKRIINVVKRQGAKTAVVVGGGYAGIEIAENLVACGLNVTICEAAEQILAPFDIEMARILEDHLREKGIMLCLQDSLQRIERVGGGLDVTLEKTVCHADFLVLAIGVKPESKLAKEAGLTCNPQGAVWTNEQMQTSDPNIYAVGDVAQVRHFLTGKTAFLPLAGPANKQGRVAANDICGIRDAYCDTQGSAILKVFDLTAAATGLNEKTARALGLRYEKSYTISPSHATYYPGGQELLIKLIFSTDDDKLLGAQVLGGEGADKRCDVLASAIRAHMTIEQLTQLELCYAPPYSSAKDPVNMAAYVAENILSGLVKVFHWHDVQSVVALPDALCLDVRTPSEFMHGHIDGFVNIPLDNLRDRLSQLDPSKKIYVHCRSGMRSYLACRILMQNGFDCYNLSGGYRLYEWVSRHRD